MKAKQIKDFDNAVASNSTVTDVNNKKHTHTGTTNKVQKYNGSGNYSDSQITDNGSTLAVADASLDASVLVNIEKAISTVKKIRNTKNNGVAKALLLLADAINSGKNYALHLSASGSTDENIGLAVENGKSIFGGTTGDGSALVEMISTSKGMLIPRMTTAQKNAISSPANGLIVFDTDLNDVYVNVGVIGSPVWVGLKSVGVSGSGVSGSVPRFNGISSIVNGTIKDDGTTVSIGGTPQSAVLFSLESQLPTTEKKSNTATTGIGTASESTATGDGSLNIGSKNFAQSKSATSTKAVGLWGLTNDVFVLPSVGNNFAMISNAVANHSADVSVGAYASATGSGAKNIGLWVKASDGTLNFSIVSETQATTILGGTESQADNSAILHLNSTTKGFLLPKMTTTQKNAIVTPATGLMVFDTSLQSVQINIGTGASPIWAGVGGSAISGTMTNGKVPRATSTNTLGDGSINDDGTNIGVGTAPGVNTKVSIVGASSQAVAVSGQSTKTNGRSSGVVGLSNGANSSENVGVDGTSGGGNKNIAVTGTTGPMYPTTATAKNYGGAFIGGNGIPNAGANIGVSAQATENNTNDNIGLEIIVANGGGGAKRIMKVVDGSDNTGKGFKIIDSNGNVALVKFVEASGSIIADQVAIFDANGNLVSDTNLTYNPTTNEFSVSDTAGGVDISPSFINLDAENYHSILQQVVASNTSGHVNLQAFWRSAGTLLTPLALSLNNTLYEKQGHGYDGTTWTQVFSELVTAGQNFNGTSHGVKWEVKTISTTASDTLKTRLTVDETGATRVKNGNLRVDDGQQGFKTHSNAISTATARTIDFNNGNCQELDIDTATGTVVITFSNMIEGTPYLLNIIQGATPREVTFAQTVRWAGGSAGKPTFASLINNQETLISIVYLNGKFIAGAVVNHS